MDKSSPSPCADGFAIHSMAIHFNEYFSSVFTYEDTASIQTVDSISSPRINNFIKIIPEIVFSNLIAISSK